MQEWKKHGQAQALNYTSNCHCQ